MYRKFVLFAAISLVSIGAHAFDPKTHVYIANEVMNDVKDDGRVEVPPFGSFAVAPDVLQSLMARPDLFLLGALGPDVLPDIIGGQVTTHAGLKNILGGWVADDWLKYLSSVPDASKQDWQAFYLGYYSHAASDIFAHTYVNNYAGDVFDLKDQDKLDVELRHFMLEKYISEYLPYRVDSASVFLSNSFNYSVVVGQTPPSQEKVNQAKKAEVLKFVQWQKDAGIFYYERYYNWTVSNINDWNWTGNTAPLQDLLKNVWTLEVDRDRVLQRYTSLNSEKTLTWPELIVAGEPIFGTSSVSEKETIRRLTDNLIRDDGVARQYQLAGVTNYLYKMDKFEERVAEEAKTLNIIKAWAREQLSKELERRSYLERLIAQYETGGTTKETVVNQNVIAPDFNADITNLPYCDSRNIWHVGAKQKGGAYYELWLLAYCPAAVKTPRQVVPLANLFDKYPKFADEARKLGLANLSHNEAAELLVLTVGVIVFYESMDVEALAMDLALKKYLNYAAKSATEEYVLANIRSAKLELDGRPLEETLVPIRNWLVCYGPIYGAELSVAPAICDGAIAAKQAAQELEASLKKAGVQLAKSTGLTNEALEIYNKYQAFEVRVQGLAVEYGKEILAGVLSDEQMKFVNIVRNPISDAGLNAAFMQDGHEVKLLKIPDMSSRVKADMHLVNNKFNPKEFAPIFNAIQLTKLSLLHEQAIREIEVKAGVLQMDHSLSYSNLNGQFNYLYSWVSSLDGNHQWMPTSPKHPRQIGFEDLDDDVHRTYSVNGGLNTWLNTNSRDLVFEKIFKGPISESYEQPKKVGVGELVPSSLATRNCDSNPFPSKVDVETCSLFPAWLIPVLGMLLH